MLGTRSLAGQSESFIDHACSIYCTCDVSSWYYWSNTLAVNLPALNAVPRAAWAWGYCIRPLVTYRFLTACKMHNAESSTKTFIHFSWWTVMINTGSIRFHFAPFTGRWTVGGQRCIRSINFLQDKQSINPIQSNPKQWWRYAHTATSLFA